MLINLAAERWKVPAIPSVSWSLTAEDGRVVHPDGRVLTYGQLTNGQKLTGVVSDQAILSKPAEWAARGTAAKKVNGRSIVTGAITSRRTSCARHAVCGRLVRPDRLGATTLVSVDNSAARALSGVTIIRDGDFLGVVAPSERSPRAPRHRCALNGGRPRRRRGSSRGGSRIAITRDNLRIPADRA